jgi:hypothetical protein
MCLLRIPEANLPLDIISFVFVFLKEFIYLFILKGLNDQVDNPPTLLLRAKAFLGVLVMNSSANSITANSS